MNALCFVLLSPIMLKIDTGCTYCNCNNRLKSSVYKGASHVRNHVFSYMTTLHVCESDFALLLALPVPLAPLNPKSQSAIEASGGETSVALKAAFRAACLLPLQELKTGIRVRAVPKNWKSEVDRCNGHDTRSRHTRPVDGQTVFCAAFV